MIAIIDYGMGNLRSVQKGFEKVGCPALITNSKNKIEDAHAVVLPGVGSFGDCMENLRHGDLIDVIHSTIKKGKPFLGICLGLQLLFTKGLEFGERAGLDIIPGKVVPFKRMPPKDGVEFKIPHMGWNPVRTCKESPFLNNSESEYFYFVHSYYVVPENEDVILAKTDYGEEFVSAILKDNIFAVQFHPEKSQENGLSILKKFGGWK